MNKKVPIIINLLTGLRAVLMVLEADPSYNTNPPGASMYS